MEVSISVHGNEDRGGKAKKTEQAERSLTHPTPVSTKTYSSFAQSRSTYNPVLQTSQQKFAHPSENRGSDR